MHLAADRDLRVNQRLSRGLLVIADAEALALAIANLLSNAVRLAHPHSEVTLNIARFVFLDPRSAQFFLDWETWPATPAAACTSIPERPRNARRFRPRRPCRPRPDVEILDVGTPPIQGW